MIFLLDTSDTLAECSADLGDGVEVGQLLTPLTRRAYVGGKYGIDNGAFSNFDRRAFRSLIERQDEHKDECLFVALPDVVGSARRTLELFRSWEGELASWPKALVAQDGIESLDIPWDDLDAIFIGGSTDWKNSSHAMDVAKCAKAQTTSIWVHVGRVNTPNRFDRWDGIADSADGTGVSKYTHMRKKLVSPPGLFNEERVA